MKNLISFFLILSSVALYSQQDLTYLTGKWKFDALYKDGEIVPVEGKDSKNFFSDMTIQFNDDSLFRSVFLGKSEQGSWKIKDKAKGLLELSSEFGNNYEVEIIDLKKDALIYKMNNTAFKMAKLPDSEKGEIRLRGNMVKTVEATKDQIARKWYLIEKESSKESSELASNVFDQLIMGSFMYLKPDGKCELKILGISENGDWAFAEGNETLITYMDGESKTWKIVEIEDSKLVLVKGLTSERWIFSSVEPEK